MVSVPALGFLCQRGSPPCQSLEVSDRDAVITKTEPQVTPKLAFSEFPGGVNGAAFSATFSVCLISNDQFAFSSCPKALFERGSWVILSPAPKLTLTCPEN